MTHLLAICLFSLTAVVPAPSPADSDFVGRWDLTVTGARGEQRPSWLEVTSDGGTLKARMVGTGGGVFPIAKAAVENGELVLSNTSTGKNAVTTVWRAKRDGAGLSGTTTVGDRPSTPFVGVRGPDWKTPKGAAAKKKPGKPVDLFNGKDLEGWSGQNAGQPLGWIVKDGALDNQGKANNIYSSQKFMDFKVEAEFAVGEHGNSGLYLRGRYEIQILDDFGKEPDAHSAGSLYGFVAPKVNASKKADEWQKLEATIVGGRVTVILNGAKVLDDEEIPGSTGGAIDSHETEPGPILLQGDHAGIKFRKVTVTPLL